MSALREPVPEGTLGIDSEPHLEGGCAVCMVVSGEHQRLGCRDRNWLPPRPDLVACRQGLLSCEDKGWSTWTISGKA